MRGEPLQYMKAFEILCAYAGKHDLRMAQLLFNLNKFFDEKYSMEDEKFVDELAKHLKELA